MKLSFMMLALADLILLGLTATFGLVVSGTQGFMRHFLLGVLSGMFTCFVHVLFFIYFVVQDKIMKQAARAGGLDAGHLRQTDALKSLALRASAAGIVSILIATGLGAAIGILVRPEVHLLAGFAAIGINGAIFLYQYSLLVRYGEVFAHAFPEG